MRYNLVIIIMRRRIKNSIIAWGIIKPKTGPSEQRIKQKTKSRSGNIERSTALINSTVQSDTPVIASHGWRATAAIGSIISIREEEKRGI